MEKKAFSVPEQLKDRYAEIEEISSGGMGVIYKACDRVLNKQVAIKMLFADSLTQNAVVRFQREARAASRFKHANLMGVLDFGMSGNNEPYLVMEFVQGKSLAAILDIRKRLSTDELVRIVTQICDGMAHAHSRDVVHRDLKPSNIMIVGSNEANGEGSIVKIVDFGIAKMEYSSDTEGWSTDPGGLIGSPLYMSPEQARGDEVDSRTDIYSLGCIMYEMLSGQAPFLEPTPVETIRAHLKNDPPPIATSHQNTLLGKDLAGVIIECLAKNVDDRPQTMQALKEKILACGFVDEGPLAAAGRKRAWFLQPRPLILASIFLFLSVSILAILDHAKRDELIRMKAAAKTRALQKRKSVWEKWVKNSQLHMRSSLAGDQDLEALVGMDAKVLDLTSSSISKKGLAILKSLPLNELVMKRVDLTDDYIAVINQCKSLNRLDVSETQIGDQGIAQLALPNLESLVVDGCKNFTDKGLDYLLVNYPGLLDLNISATSVTNAGISKVVGFGRLGKLQLGSLRVSKKNMDDLSNLPLNLVNLSGCRMTREALLKTCNFRSLKVLEIVKTEGADIEVERKIRESFLPGKIDIVFHEKSASEQMEGARQITDFLGRVDFE